MVSAFHRNRKALAIEHIHKLHPMDPPLPKNSQKNPLVSTLSKEDKVQHLEFCKREPRKLCNFPPEVEFPMS